MKKLEKVVFFIPRLLIRVAVSTKKALISGAVVAKNSTDKKDVIMLLGMSSFFYGACLIYSPLAYIMLGFLLLKLSGL